MNIQHERCGTWMFYMAWGGCRLKVVNGGLVCILKRIVRVREANRGEQHRIPVVDLEVGEGEGKWAVMSLGVLSKWKITMEGYLYHTHEIHSLVTP